MDSQVKKKTRKINPEIGTLSGFKTMDLKSGSPNPKIKNATSRTLMINKAFLPHNALNLKRRCHLSNQSDGGKIKKKMIKVKVTKIVGFVRPSIKCLNPSITRQVWICPHLYESARNGQP